jgi:hypothetical protein
MMFVTSGAEHSKRQTNPFIYFGSANNVKKATAHREGMLATLHPATPPSTIWEGAIAWKQGLETPRERAITGPPLLH